MTEDKAKTKACFRAASFGGSQQLVDGPGPHCIGSTCMAWRWQETTTLARALFEAEAGRKIDAIKELRAVFPKISLMDAKNIVDGKTPWPADPASEGYCGLAGPPA